MKKIEVVDGLYRWVIQTLSSNPSVLSVILSQDTKKYQGMTLRMIFSTGIEAMEEIILQMNHLLESARQEFPRLYFLSDDDLLHLLTLSSDPRKLLPFVTKCFRGIQDLEYQVINSPNLIIPPRVNVLAIHGDLQERVNLTPPLEAAPKTIPWLRNLELRIQQNLFLSLDSCVAERTALAREINSKIMVESLGRSEAYKAAQLMKPILKLANSFPVQCILIAEDFCWLSDMKKVLFKRSISKEWFKTLYSTKIDRLVMSVRGLCKHSYKEADNPRVLLLLKCLISKSMNHRDIADNLIASNIQSEASFEWHKFIKYQFGFNWIFPRRESLKPLATHFGHSVPGSDKSKFGLRCYINLLGNNYFYDYEYISPKTVCVQNPVTERMCLAMIFALQNFNPCALVGTYGTGKSSTISHLAQVLGYQLVIFQCCKNMSLAFITRILSGAIQSGAWLVLENTDILPMGTLSVLGQLLNSIQNSYRELTTKDISDRSYTDCGTRPHRKEFGTNLELVDTDHYVNKQTVNNILVLYQTLKVSKGVIMVGCSGSGKTTSYRTLSRTLNLLARNEPKSAAHQSESIDPPYRTVQVSVCFPNSLSTEELLGAMDHQIWKNGIVSKWLSEGKSWSQARALVKEFQSPQVKVYHCPEPLRWIVLDGELCLDWLGPISSLLTRKQSLTLSNGDQIPLIESTSLIFEVTDLSNAPPSAVTWCNVVHCQGSHMWEAVLANMLKKIYSNYSVPRNIVELFSRLGQDLIPKTIAFLEQHCIPALTQQADYSMIQQNRVAQGLQEVMTFTNILKVLLDKHLLRDQQQEDSA
eukprot:g45363.t1